MKRERMRETERLNVDLGSAFNGVKGGVPRVL